jgi:rod shape-determining protein MreC
MLNSTLIKIARKDDLLKFFIFVFLCLTLLIAQKEFRYSFPLKNYLYFWVEPIRSIPDVTFRWYQQFNKFFSALEGDLQSRVDYLEKQNTILSAQVRQLPIIKQQNKELFTLLGVKAAVPNFNVKLAEVKYVNNNSVLREISINLGVDDGIEVGQAVIDAKGIIGQVKYVGLSSSKVLLLTAPSVSVSVYNKRNGLRAITNGSSTGLRLDAPDTGLNIIVGDVFVATGLGNVFPSGYPVGRVTKIQSDRYVIRTQMQPVTSLQALKKVLVLKKN